MPRSAGNSADQFLAWRKGRVSFARWIWSEELDLSSGFQGYGHKGGDEGGRESDAERTLRVRVVGTGTSSCGELRNGPRARVETANGPFP